MRSLLLIVAMLTACTGVERVEGEPKPPKPPAPTTQDATEVGTALAQFTVCGVGRADSDHDRSNGCETDVQPSLAGSAARLSIGAEHACAVTNSGAVACLGRNDVGQLGWPGGDDAVQPVLVPDIENAAFVASGMAHSCALTSTGDVWCWGANEAGQLGNGIKLPEGAPEQVEGLPKASALDLGPTHSCAKARDDSQWWCWGEDGSGAPIVEDVPESQLRPAKATSPSKPSVPDTDRCKDIDALTGRLGLVCGVCGDGRTVRCWDRTEEEQVYRGEVVFERDVAALSVGQHNVCVRLGADAIYCWGNPGLVLGTTSADALSVASPLVLETGVSAFSLNARGACVVQDEGIRCWGRIPGHEPTAEPFPLIQAPSDVADLALGPDAVCVVTTDRHVYCHGRNRNGEAMPGGETFIKEWTEVAVDDVAQVWAAKRRTCAQKHNGELVCWGHLGDPQTPPTSKGAWEAVGVSDTTICGVGDNGVECDGQPLETPFAPDEIAVSRTLLALADGEQSAFKVLGRVVALEESPVDTDGWRRLEVGATALAAGGDVMCGTTADGQVWCVGQGDNGQLGRRSRRSSAKAEPVVGLEGVKELQCAGQRCCALGEGGGLMCWGRVMHQATGLEAVVDEVLPVWTRPALATAWEAH